MSKKKLKFKSLLSEYRSLSFENQYVDEVLDDWNMQFEIYYRRYCVDNDIDLAQLNKEHSGRVSSIFSSSTSLAMMEKQKKNEIGFDSKAIFKQIARKFHPDKLSEDDPRRGEYEEVFKKATSAIDEGIWGEVFDLADKYEIPLHDYDGINESLRFDIKKIKKIIQDKKNRYSWLLYECDEDKDCMNQVVKKFLNHLFRI
jgi:hypothetical protein